jgi:hypothetical protein
VRFEAGAGSGVKGAGAAGFALGAVLAVFAAAFSRSAAILACWAAARSAAAFSAAAFFGRGLFHFSLLTRRLHFRSFTFLGSPDFIF